MLGVEFVEAVLVFALVLGEAGVAGDERVERFGGTDLGEKLVGFDVQVGGVEFGGLVVPCGGEEIVPVAGLLEGCG
ncbi:hypothetical protein ACEE90_05810 [Corynebacterium phoceense]